MADSKVSTNKEPSVRDKYLSAMHVYSDIALIIKWLRKYSFSQLQGKAANELPDIPSLDASLELPLKICKFHTDKHRNDDFPVTPDLNIETRAVSELYWIYLLLEGIEEILNSRAGDNKEMAAQAKPGRKVKINKPKEPLINSVLTGA